MESFTRPSSRASTAVAIAPRSDDLFTTSTLAIFSGNAVDPRAPPLVATPYPLLRPNPAEGVEAQLNFVRRIKYHIRKGEPAEALAGDIAINPEPEQLSGWIVKDRKGYSVPLSVTAEYFPFRNRPQNWKMDGMTGCTAVFVVVCFSVSIASGFDLWSITNKCVCFQSQHGMWAGHFWEPGKKIPTRMIILVVLPRS